MKNVKQFCNMLEKLRNLPPSQSDYVFFAERKQRQTVGKILTWDIVAKMLTIEYKRSNSSTMMQNHKSKTRHMCTTKFTKSRPREL
jgi:hypothetical protein